MRVVIDIPKEMYDHIKLGKDGYSNYVHTAIRNGTPIPKGCGRLIDADELKKEYPHDTDWDYPVNTNCSVVESIDNAETIIEADLEEDDSKIKESDILEATLLSVEEAKELPKEVLKADKHWWLRSPGILAYEAAFVNDDFGIVFVGGIGVDREYGVRPALKLKSSLFKKGDSFYYNGYEWDVIGDNLALCRTIVGECAFRKCLKADDANNYETSDIKKWLNDWWKDGEKVRNEK